MIIPKSPPKTIEFKIIAAWKESKPKGYKRAPIIDPVVTFKANMIEKLIRISKYEVLCLHSLNASDIFGF